MVAITNTLCRWLVCLALYAAVAGCSAAPLEYTGSTCTGQYVEVTIANTAEYPAFTHLASRAPIRRVIPRHEARSIAKMFDGHLPDKCGDVAVIRIVVNGNIVFEIVGDER